MKLLHVVIVSISIIVFLPSCEKLIGKGPVITENRAVSPFVSVSFGVDAACYFTQSNRFFVEISAQQNILDEIETVIINNELKIRLRHPSTIRTSESIIVRVEAPNVNGLTVDGSSFLQLDNPLTAGALKLLISGSGSIRAEEINTSAIDATISGSGNMYVRTGQANEDVARVSGSGYIDLAGVAVKDANTHISGSGTIAVNVEKTLHAQISGSGTVFYYGNPVIISSISGSGRVVKL